MTVNMLYIMSRTAFWKKVVFLQVKTETNNEGGWVLLLLTSAVNGQNVIVTEKSK